jgi:hypothetical protein
MMENITLTIYFSGTGHSIENNEMLAGALHSMTLLDKEHAKMGFDGCGVEYGCSGAMFGTGLEEQCEQVVENVIGMLKIGKRVRLNAYGHSRGAVACLLLAKKLGKFDRDILEINLVLMDPVPGNLISSAALDFTHRTLARQALDVSDCRNLTRVLAIYPHEPLPDYAFHAPIIPQYPPYCEVTEEIIPGCHAGAQLMRNDIINGFNNASRITFSMVTQFLVKLGTTFTFLTSAPSADQEVGMRNRLLRLYTEAFNVQQDKNLSLTRPCHAASSVAIKTQWPANFLSHTHKKLHYQANDIVLDEKSNESQDYAYFFSRKKASARVAPVNLAEPELSLNDIAILFAEMLNQIYVVSMSSKSRHHSQKGELIKECVLTLLEPEFFTDEAELKDTMRNALAICLQRDRNALSPFSMTRSGIAARELLNSKKYRAIANMILNADDKKIRYRDLRTFVLGRNDERHFNAERSQSMYQFFQAEPEDTGYNSKLLANNMSYHLARR